jgi:glucans biosynthesis protein
MRALPAAVAAVYDRRNLDRHRIGGHRPPLQVVFFGLALLLFTAPLVRAAGELFDFEVLRYRAKMLALAPYAPRPARVPESLLKLTYDQHRRIQFNAAETWWRDQRLPFQLQFFHPGSIFNRAIPIAEVRGREATAIPFLPQMFNYDGLEIGEIPETMGFAGFRILYDLNKPADELGVFLGASYFRMLCRKAVYGLSARGLALDTGEPTAEEFPCFEEFWVKRPAPDARDLVVYALLDSPRVAGAYRFIIRPGDDTVMQVRTALYLRQPVKVFGVAPLTSMYWYGENSQDHFGDFRPEVHDSDGLMIQHGSGEWVWRPLTNPGASRSMAFADENPHGFGLIQRDRRFSSYEDLEANYHLRPSAWVEPVGPWGRGVVRLVELPTPTETNDNIVAFWQPAELPAPGEPIELEYRLHWFIDQIKPPAGYAVGTRVGRALAHEPGVTRFNVDFDGPYLHNQPDDPAIEAIVSVGEGAELVHQTIQKNRFNGTWRVAFALRPDGSGSPVELRCFLRKPPHVLTETWTYRWNP